MNDTILKTINLSKQYKKNMVLNHVNLEIKQGDIYGLVGKNGAGKTTLLRILTGLAAPTKGSIELFGENSVGGLGRARRRTGSIIETPSLYPYLSAEKNLEYYSLQRGITEPDGVRRTLELVGLEGVGNKKYKNFSLGMKQRLGLALAILANPDLLILDEPINGLDPTGIVEFRGILQRLNRERNITIIISSHLLGELSQLATTYGFINNGEFIEQISAAQLEVKCKNALAIKAKNIEQATVVLENILKTTNYKVMNHHELHLYDYLNTPEQVIKELVDNNVILTEVRQMAANLEDYYLNLIGGGKHA